MHSEIRNKLTEQSFCSSDIVGMNISDDKFRVINFTEIEIRIVMNFTSEKKINLTSIDNGIDIDGSRWDIVLYLHRLQFSSFSYTILQSAA